jgi:hypothetical protein
MRSVSLLIALAAALSAADDPGGWTAAKWGMTEAQLRDAFPAQPVSVELAGTTFHVRFISTKDALTQVKLDPVEPVKQGLDSLFQDLQNMLVEKYGRPWSSTEGPTSELQWTFKTTTISLSRVRLSGFGTQFVFLTYRKKVESPI